MLGIAVSLICIVAVLHPRTHYDFIATQLLFFASMGAMAFGIHTLQNTQTLLIVEHGFWLCYISLILTAIWIPVNDLIGMLRDKPETRTRSLYQ